LHGLNGSLFDRVDDACPVVFHHQRPDMVGYLVGSHDPAIHARFALH
jgi:hypothetical protein